MDTFTSMTYSVHKKGDIEACKKFEYKSTITDDDKIMCTSYNTMITDEEQIESFNRLLQSHNNTLEQIGNSKNKTEWDIKEYHNNNLNKEYKDPYDKHSFNMLNQYIGGNLGTLPIGN